MNENYEEYRDIIQLMQAASKLSASETFTETVMKELPERDSVLRRMVSHWIRFFYRNEYEGEDKQSCCIYDEWQDHCQARKIGHVILYILYHCQWRIDRTLFQHSSCVRPHNRFYRRGCILGGHVGSCSEKNGIGVAIMGNMSMTDKIQSRN